MRLPTAVLLFLLLASSSGCVTWDDDTSTLPVAELSGHLLPAEGASWFEPCAPIRGSERLWVTYTEGSAQQVEAARREGRLVRGERYFVRWRAAVTDERHVGPGGPALLVREIVELRPAAAQDCAAP